MTSAREPVFFISYAHRPRRRRRPENEIDPVEEFYAALSEHIYELVGLRVGAAAGFMDTDMDGGQRWSAELAYAIGHCQVLVPLLSPNYLTSEWCAKEWRAFQRRPHRSIPGTHPTPGSLPVIPVRWAPVDVSSLPAEMRAVQVFKPAKVPAQMAQSYEDEGLYGLLQTGEQGREAYTTVVWRLAQRIALAYGTHHVEPDEDVDFGEGAP
ncbi:TIR-like protein FxsC [Actinoplanes oblitus]|uniref:TIR-like protein FxsC n=1 Tax=Actinoplanes oblitus TaxID=3040509 RepID=A0ABY8W6N7_9ACTN|nr:TIR-like protein FxsC [Actinoplanes oblitus]WIM93172.1 TIR-like protein FxsC [Actinoplanes oblitus]